eukprot:gnl/TRDRNA2_/TRDRNA2_136546_c1_seq1.p1 gnl/TRDRNA2_/TRDRNA2_136546_c1~~gnl/TRDRNA2_/TRDRNA2_136546_c1_seq1.p1  ORF type:complete len:206 (+),score=76.59 gnl/TRDRNA2_/TRDRNA2_136546_c1_seq1:2-619(+)
MSKQISDALTVQKDMTKAMEDATEMRNAEKAENEKTIKDSKIGAEATKKALTVLREFYAKQGSFVQTGVHASGKAHGKAHGGGGVIGMLEVIESDFLRVLSDTKAAEKASQRDFEAFMADSQKTKKLKHDEEVELKLAKDQAEFDMGETKKDLGMNSDELDKANKYYDNLKPQCMGQEMSYEEKVRRREEEIESLKNTYKILDDA